MSTSEEPPSPPVSAKCPHWTNSLPLTADVFYGWSLTQMGIWYKCKDGQHYFVKRPVWKAARSNYKTLATFHSKIVWLDEIFTQLRIKAFIICLRA